MVETNMTGKIKQDLNDFIDGNYIFVRSRHQDAALMALREINLLQGIVRELEGKKNRTAEINVLTKQVTELKEANEVLEKTNQQLNTSMQALGTQVDNYDFRVSMLERESDDWKKKYLDLVAQLKALSATE